MVGHGREVLALVELGPVTLEALPDGVFDVAGQGGGGLAVALQEQHGRPGLVGDAPPNLHHHATAWARREGIYQRYMGWFDGNPTSLWQHPPQAVATRYVEVIGGQQAVLDKARPTPTPATCASPPSCSSTPCSPAPTTRRPRTPWPTCTSDSATAPRTRPGEASTSPAR